MKAITTFKSSNDYYIAYVKQFTPLGKWDGTYCVCFEAFGHMDNDYRGTNGTGCKRYNTLDSAIAAAKRYTKKFSY